MTQGRGGRRVLGWDFHVVLILESTPFMSDSSFASTIYDATIHVWSSHPLLLIVV